MEETLGTPTADIHGAKAPEFVDVMGNDTEPLDIHGIEKDTTDFHGNVETELTALGQEKPQSKWADFVGGQKERADSFTARLEEESLHDVGHTAA